MPKKTFKDDTAYLDRFFSDSNRTHETHRAHQETPPLPPAKDSSNAPGKPPSPPSAPKYYRLNLKLKAEYKPYLERVSWENHKSITQYLNDLIEADKTARNT